MIEIFTFICIMSMFLALFLSVMLCLLRIIIVIKDKRSLVASILIVLIPAGIGYYHYYPESNNIKTWYQRSVVVMFICTLLGSIFMAFINIPEFAQFILYG